MPGRRLGILEGIQPPGGLLKTEAGKGPLGLGIIPSIQERVNKILKR